MDRESIYKQQEQEQEKFIENTNDQVAPEPEIFAESDEETTEETAEEENIETQVEEEVVETTEEGQKEETTKPLTVEDKLKKRINTITAQKKALEETKEEEISLLKQQVAELQNKSSAKDEAEGSGYTLEDVASEISRVENLISNGEVDEAKADGSNHNLNVYLNRLTREHNKMYVENQRTEAETNINNSDSQKIQLQQEVINVEKDIMSVTGVQDANKLKDHALTQVVKALLINQPDKYDRSKVGGITNAFHDALKMCIQDGLFINPHTTQSKSKTKSAIIPGAGSGSGISGSKSSDPVIKNEEENKNYITKMIDLNRKRTGIA